jgi:hypothetical protein
MPREIMVLGTNKLHPYLCLYVQPLGMDSELKEAVTLHAVLQGCASVVHSRHEEDAQQWPRPAPCSPSPRRNSWWQPQQAWHE